MILHFRVVLQLKKKSNPSKPFKRPSFVSFSPGTWDEAKIRPPQRGSNDHGWWTVAWILKITPFIDKVPIENGDFHVFLVTVSHFWIQMVELWLFDICWYWFDLCLLETCHFWGLGEPLPRQLGGLDFRGIFWRHDFLMKRCENIMLLNYVLFTFVHYIYYKMI